ncbi:MAG: hypothetical protein Q8K60_03620 [Parachlamydiaceae bacterium]|nr:hypothetical protein [Parachlamydiaceae bacterium]
MLKLERIPHIGVSVRFREKESLFNSEMLRAIGLAVLFHLLMIGLFTVTPFHQDSKFIFSPIQVHLEHPILNVTSFFTDSNHEIDFLPSHDLNKLSDSKELIHQLFSLQAPTFDTTVPNFALLELIEKRVWPIWEPTLTTNLKKPPIEITLSGGIAKYPYSVSNLHLNQRDSTFSSHPISINYDVKIDSKNGKIFWFESNQPISNKIAHFLEKIIKDLKFEIEESSIILNGKINFSVLIDELEERNDD